MAEVFDWVFTLEELRDSPSRKDGITWENEKALRHNSCSFILAIGKHLRRGQDDKTAYIRDSAACILFHRFFTVQSFKSHSRLIIGAACLFLAGKIEGCFRHLSEIVQYYCKVRDQEGSPTKADLQKHQEMILVAERAILHTLGFDMHIDHHFKPLTSKFQADLKMYIPLDTRIPIVNSAFSFLRDSFGTVLCLLYPPHLRAAAALFLALLQLGISPQPPDSHHIGGSSANSDGLVKSWYELFHNDITEETLKDICFQIMEVYESKKWKPSSELKTLADITRLKSQLSSFFGDVAGHDMKASTKDYNSSYILNSDSELNSKEGHMTQPQIEEKNIEIIAEKDTKNRSKYDMKKENSTSMPPRNDFEVNCPPPPGAVTSVPVFTPEFVPPPPPPPAALPPPTPEFIPPPPIPPNIAVVQSDAFAQSLPKPLPTPEYIPPPPVPSQVSIPQQFPTCNVHVKSENDQARNDLRSGHSFTSNSSKREHTSTTELNLTNGYTSAGSDSLGSPPAYCSPKRHSDNVSPKRARLHYKQ